MQKASEEHARSLREIELEHLSRVLSAPPSPPPELPTIPCSELAEAPAGSPLATEWNYYRREVRRLLTEGLAGKWLLIKGEEIIGIWDTQAEADEVRLQRFPLQPVLQKQILEREPLIRCTRFFHPGFLQPWRS